MLGAVTLHVSAPVIHATLRHFAARFSLLSVSDSIDTRTASGRLVLHVLGAVGQWEREATAERTRDALAQLRADGVRLGADPLGWRRTCSVSVSAGAEGGQRLALRS